MPINCDFSVISHKHLFIKWVRVFSVHQKRGPKRRLKARGNGSMGVASERAVSIPQITYDHIDDSVEKKDVSFFQDEQRGGVEGKILQRVLLIYYCSVQCLNQYEIYINCYCLSTCFSQENQLTPINCLSLNNSTSQDYT